MFVTAGTLHQSAVLADTREGQVRVGADVPLVRGETGCSLWDVQQLNVVGCCPGGLTFFVRRCCAVALVHMLAIEVANLQTGVWEHGDGRWCEPRAWRFVHVDDPVFWDVYAQPLKLWMLWRLIDHWSFPPLVNKRGKAVIPAQDQLVQSWDHYKLMITSLSKAWWHWTCPRSLEKSDWEGWIGKSDEDSRV